MVILGATVPWAFWAGFSSLMDAFFPNPLLDTGSGDVFVLTHEEVRRQAAVTGALQVVLGVAILIALGAAAVKLRGRPAAPRT